MANKRIPLQVKDLTGDIQTLSGYVVALRSGTFVANTITGTEASDNPGYYDFENIEPNVAYQLWAGASESTMTMNTAFSSEEGAVIYGIDDTYLIDPADYDDYDVPTKVTVGNVEQFLPKTLNEIVDGAGLSMNDYYFLRGKLYQDNSVYSGAPFFGAMFVNSETGALVGGSQSYHQNGANSIVTTISNYVRRSTSAKVTTGVYYLQCMVGATTGAAGNGFITALAGVSFRYKFENSVIPVYGSRTVDLGVDGYEETYVPGLVGYVVLDVNDSIQTYYDTGKLLIKTYNTSWVLTDDILTYGCTLTFKALKINV